MVAPGQPRATSACCPATRRSSTTLGIGELTYRIGRDEYHVAVAGGFAEVRNDKVIILADAAEAPADIDRARAERAARPRRGPAAGRRRQEEIDYTRAAAALARALTRLQVAGRGQLRVHRVVTSGGRREP